MHRPHAPTVRPQLPVRRLLAGALAVGAVAIVAPAAANAGVSSCSYSAATKTLSITDLSGSAKLRLVRVGDQIRIADGQAGTSFCAGGPLQIADVHNTDKIQVFRDGLNAPGGLDIDMTQGAFGPGATPESDGSSEIEIAVTDTSSDPLGFTNVLRVIGSAGNDTIVANANGAVNFGNDFDLPDVTYAGSQFAPFAVEVHGGAGNDRIRGAGLARQGNVVLLGDDGNDTLMGGVENDRLVGGAGDDRLAGVDGFGESIDGDDILNKDAKGNDFATVDDEDSVVNVETQSIEVHGVGRLKLKRSLHAVAGQAARVRLAWRHPKAWKALRSLEWRLMDGVDRVGTVKIRPRGGRLTTSGAVKLAAGSSVSHHGKTVTARLRLRLPATLAGEALTADVAATDAKGHRQIEAAAALIDVTA
jgi:Ca2+-binding RTX toxin-like protein